MNREAIIAAKERVLEMRVKQYYLSKKEMEMAKKIQASILLQSSLEDKIMEWEVEIAKLKGSLVL